MPQPITITLIVLCSVALGLGLANLLNADDEPSDHAAHGDSAISSEESLRRIEGLLADLLAEMRKGKPRKTGASAGPRLKALQTATAKTSPAPAKEPTVELNEGGPASMLLPEAASERLAPLGDWYEDKSTRRQWLFTSERTALDWFGTPDVVRALATEEVWIYRCGDDRDEDRSLVFSRGRLIRID